MSAAWTRMIFDANQETYDAGGDLLQIGDDYILYVDGGKEEATEKHKSYFKDIARITLIRSKRTRRVRAIEYRIKGHFSAFTTLRIDGCGAAEMEEIASLLEKRTQGFPIKWVEKRGDTSLIPLFIIAVFAVLLGYIVYLVWRYPVLASGKYASGVILALTLVGSIPVLVGVYKALYHG